MDWKQRRGYIAAQGHTDMYNIIQKRSGKYFVEVRMPGGRTRDVGFNQFDTLEGAKKWAQERDSNRGDASKAVPW